MTTAYTSLLGLALPVQGELSGTWGDTVNTAITGLLDTAIAGTTSISTDADTTLTTTTGAANTARQAVILWNPAAGTVTRNITAPAQSKMYTVINASGGTQSIVLRGAGPTTGVTILKGESAIVAWNGSDFIKVSNTSGAGVFTSLTVSGTTTLSGLSPSSALALDASKNVVSVTNTGTGSNVLSTNPTFTGTVAGAALGLSSLTSGRVTYATALGLLTDSANLTFNGTTLTANTIGAFTLAGTVAGGGNQLNNVIIGTTTPLAGAFTTLSATGPGIFSADAAAFALYLRGRPSDNISALMWNTNAGVETARMFVAADGSFTFANASATARLNIDSVGQSQFITSGSIATLTLNDTGASGANLKLSGNGGTTPNKFVRAASGVFQILNSAYSIVIFQVDDAGALSLVGDISVNKASPSIVMSANASGQNVAHYARTAGVDRWQWGKGASAESGANAGSDFFINRYSDAGAYLSAPLSISRSTGEVTLSGNLNMGSQQIKQVANIGGYSDTQAWSIWGGSSVLNGGYFQLYGGSHATAPNIIIFGANGAERMRMEATGRLLAPSGIVVAPVAFASLPASPVAGQRAMINNSVAAPAFLSAAAGGGAVTVPVFYNGTSWLVG